MLRSLKYQSEYFGTYYMKKNERLMGDLNDEHEKHERVCPSNEYMEDLRQGYEGVIFEMPAPPDVGEFGRVLDRHQIDGIERRICEYSAQGMSNAEIARQMGVKCGATKVGEILARFRKQDTELASILKGGTPGAKKKGNGIDRII